MVVADAINGFVWMETVKKKETTIFISIETHPYRYKKGLRVRISFYYFIFILLSVFCY